MELVDKCAGFFQYWQGKIHECFGNGSSAAKCFCEAAQNGDADAQYEIGKCCENGVGVEKNQSEAVKWYQKAAEQGNSDAQDSLGWCYENGLGVDKNQLEAVEWYRKAAEQENAKAQTSLGRCYFNGFGVAQNYERSVEWYRKAAKKGNAWAQNALGWCYENGLGVVVSLEEAVSWYKKAAEQDNAVAQTNLGRCYFNWVGICKYYGEAVKWYKIAAKKGDAEAQDSLGWCYENGFGITQSRVEALKWYRKSAAQGNEKAKISVGRCCRFVEACNELRERYSKPAIAAIESLGKDSEEYSSATECEKLLKKRKLQRLTVSNELTQIMNKLDAGNVDASPALEEKISVLIKEVNRLGEERRKIDDAISQVYPTFKEVKAQIAKNKTQCDRLGEDIKILNAYDKRLSNANDGRDRWEIHSEVEARYGDGSPGRICSKKRAELRQYEGHLEQLRKDLAKLDDRLCRMINEACRQIDFIIIDGSNLAYENGRRIGPKAAIAVANELSKLYPITIVFDREWEHELPRIQKRLNNSVTLYCAHNRADEEILKKAETSRNAYVISNDRFADYPDYSCVKEGRIFKHHIGDGHIQIYDLDICLPFSK